VVIDARALDTDLGGEIAKAETAISGIADMVRREIHQSFGSSLSHRPTPVMSIPNIYFHLAMAYAILRHNGVDIGKMDFLGPINWIDA
jgi:hypothetical protein